MNDKVYEELLSKFDEAVSIEEQLEIAKEIICRLPQEAQDEILIYLEELND